ncbi:hypothetical protein [Bdellovibrio sp. NC01]|uniref:hypothetical protein n=1 Tax=Bdellovibrio sp. NC01 TaxID=2220073 RepID=UPI00115A997D|nr:hypothetical protein [Bdellovibrio sp. NC01]QDK37472.1 hypothetical protein DOE51_07675 [Bdellovibrio sp. NC01]
MKHFFLIILSLFFTAGSLAHPGGPITPPWPLSISTAPLDIETLPGEWVAYSHNTIWFLQIELNANGRGLAAIHIQSNAIRNHKVDGWLAPDQNALIGEILVDENRSQKIMIFKDKDGTKLRIAAGGNGYYDLKLYKREKGK